MIFIISAVIIFILGGWILKRYCRLDYGAQTWHVFAVYGLFFMSIIMLFLGVLSYTCGEGDNENIFLPVLSNNQEYDSDLGIIDKHNHVSKKIISDTLELAPFLYSRISNLLDSSRVIIPVINSPSGKFYLLRDSCREVLLPIEKTEIVMDNNCICVITRKEFELFASEKSFKDKDPKLITYKLKIIGNYLLLK